MISELIIFKLHTFLGSNSTLFFSNWTLFQLIRSAHVSNLMNDIIAFNYSVRSALASNTNLKMATVITAVATCCHCKGTWMLEML